MRVPHFSRLLREVGLCVSTTPLRAIVVPTFRKDAKDGAPTLLLIHNKARAAEIEVCSFSRCSHYGAVARLTDCRTLRFVNVPCQEIQTSANSNVARSKIHPGASSYRSGIG